MSKSTAIVSISFTGAFHDAEMTNKQQNQQQQQQDASQQENGLYHQRQSLMLCAVHAINNVLQRDAVTKADLNAICDQLAPDRSPLLNPHRNMFGLGNFDANALIVALQATGHDIVWFDKRTSLAEHRIDWTRVVGCILNARRKRQAPVNVLGGRHWVAFRGFPADDSTAFNYYDLDSKLRKPALVARSHREFAEYIENRLKELPDSQLLFVVPKEVLAERTWRLPEEPLIEEQQAQPK